MEQATNQFTKGLQLDTHPMVQSNDTLTDCLNGTLITMNGNEVILQNDMGNRRVDKAFLPSGYEPVGVKEYGGIIYVASYNPITNKSQIGSFPSPQKKFSSEVEGEQAQFDFNIFMDDSNTEKDSNLGIQVLKSDSFMIPLTNDLVLRAGDKFAVYSEGLSELKNSLTNYDNISDSKANSPKNKKYTLQLGVLNSQNEFVDITKTLCRWRDFGKDDSHDWQPINYSSEVSEIYKFNDGYFISDAFNNSTFDQTIEDSKLIKERQKIAANTYSYKLVGPLYLKILFNHIENFNYNIYGIYDGTNATLWIEGYITYNCPDEATIPNPNLNNNSNENYATFEEGTPSNNFGFDLIGRIPDKNFNGSEKSIYNPSTNTYTTKVVKKYVGIKGVNSIFNYVLGVKASVDSNDDNIYLRELSTKGSIDLSLLGSGQLKFNGWKFHNNFEKRTTLLTFAFNAYPEYGKSFTNLRFNFKKINDSIGINYPKQGYLPIYNGKQTISFSWDEVGLQPKTIYEVTAYYSILNNSTGLYEQENVQITDNIQRWLLTTELFNSFYHSSSGITDFCNVSNNNTEFYDKMKITPELESSVKNGSSIYSEPQGSLMTKDSSAISYLYEHNQKVELEVSSKFVLNNPDLYPTSVSVKESSDSIEINKAFVSRIEDTNSPSYDSLTNGVYNYSTTLRSYLTTTSGLNVTNSGDNNPTTALENQDILETKVSKTTNTVSGYIKYYDVYKGKGTTITNVTNAFDDFSEILDSNHVLPTTGKYTGVVVNFDYRDTMVGSARDNHYIDVVVNQEKTNVELPEDDEHPSGWYNVADAHEDGGVTFNMSHLGSLIYQLFNQYTEGTNLTFLYLFCDNNYYTSMPSLTQGKDGKYNTRVWWKMPNGEWAVFPQLLSKQNAGTTIDIVNFIKQGIGNKELVYCMHNTYSQTGFMYTAKDDFIYYNPYDIELDYTITYKLKDGVSISSLITSNDSCGNLQFIAGSPKLNSNIVNYKLKSSETFFDDINMFDPDHISNIYLKTGDTTDSVGRPLNSSYVYFLEEGKLVRIDDNRFYVDNINPVDGKNKLLYNKIRKGSVSPKCQSAANGTSHTVLSYDIVNIVDAV